MQTGLTTHVLNTQLGDPAEGVKIELWRITFDGKLSPSPTKICMVMTDDNGRTSVAETLRKDIYELRFFIGEYFKGHRVDKRTEPNPGQGEAEFIDEVSVRFSVFDPERHYHIPLVASPWSYTTYKGGAPMSKS